MFFTVFQDSAMARRRHSMDFLADFDIFISVFEESRVRRQGILCDLEDVCERTWHTVGLSRKHSALLVDLRAVCIFAFLLSEVLTSPDLSVKAAVAVGALWLLLCEKEIQHFWRVMKERNITKIITSPELRAKAMNVVRVFVMWLCVEEILCFFSLLELKDISEVLRSPDLTVKATVAVGALLVNVFFEDIQRLWCLKKGKRLLLELLQMFEALKEQLEAVETALQEQRRNSDVLTQTKTKIQELSSSVHEFISAPSVWRLRVATKQSRKAVQQMEQLCVDLLFMKEDSVILSQDTFDF